MQSLIINDAIKHQIKCVVDYAEANRIGAACLLRIVQGDDHLIPGNQPGHVCVVPFGYRCVFSIEEQINSKMKVIGWHRHLSVSVPNDKSPSSAGKTPTGPAMGLLMMEFGFRGDFSKMSSNELILEVMVKNKVVLRVEQFGEPARNAINVLQSYDP
jgi:hypothetical protein